jgi:hypothetical protein
MLKSNISLKDIIVPRSEKVSKTNTFIFRNDSNCLQIFSNLICALRRKRVSNIHMCILIAKICTRSFRLYRSARHKKVIEKW